MRADYRNPETGPGATVLLVGFFAVVFVIQHVVHTAFGGDGLLWDSRPGFASEWLALSLDTFRSGRLWTLVSYAFFHAFFLHILINGVVLFFMGKAVEQTLGDKTVLEVFWTSVVTGGLLWVLLHLISDSSQLGGVIGASAGVSGILCFFCLQRAHQPTTFLLFFVIPVRLKPIWIIYGLGAYTVFSMVFVEFGWLGRGDLGATVAHSAHLGGGLGGVLIYWLYATRRLQARPGWHLWTALRSLRRPRTARTVRAPQTRSRVDLGSEAEKDRDPEAAHLKREVDRILDKINAEGFGSLTEREKELLHRAREIIGR